MADVDASLVKALDGTAPQYKRKGAQAFDPVEGSDGALHTKIVNSSGNTISEQNPLDISVGNAKIEVISESSVEFSSGVTYATPFRVAKGNKIVLAFRTGLLSLDISVRIVFYNRTSNGYMYAKGLTPKIGDQSIYHLYECENYGNAYQILITNNDNRDSTFERLYLHETVGIVIDDRGKESKGGSKLGLSQIMDRGQKTYDDSAISLANRDVIFEVTKPFILDHFYYIYEPKNREDAEGLNKNHTLMIYLRVGSSWVPYNGAATNNVGRINAYPKSIVGEDYNGQFPHYNVLEYNTLDAVYAFEINKEIKAAEGLQIGVHSAGLEDGGESVFSYQLRGRILDD